MSFTIDGLTFLLTLLAFYFAYYQWVKHARERRTHLLKALKVQLDCLGPWLGFPGYGYGDELTEDQKFDNANPYKLIYETASEALVNLNMLDNITNVDEIIIGELNQLYYDLVRIKNINAFRNNYALSAIETSNNISRKLQEYLCKTSMKSLIEFIETLTDEDEKVMVQRLVNYGKVLHCDVIGNKDRSARQHWEKLQHWVVIELNPRDDCPFIVITFIVVFGTGFGLGLFQYASIFFWAVLVFVGFFINLINGSLNKTLSKAGYKKTI